MTPLKAALLIATLAFAGGVIASHLTRETPPPKATALHCAHTAQVFFPLPWDAEE
jgi:hypothetical protein